MTEEQLVRLAMLEAQMWRPFHEQPPTDGQYLALWESGCISCEFHEVGRNWKQGVTHWRPEPNRLADYKRQDVSCENTDCEHNRASHGALHNPHVCAPGLVYCACRKPKQPMRYDTMTDSRQTENAAPRGTIVPGSIGEYMDAHEGEPLDEVANAVIEKWPHVLAPCSYTEPGHGLTRKQLAKLIVQRRQDRARTCSRCGTVGGVLEESWVIGGKRVCLRCEAHPQRHESEGLNASSEYPDV